ACGVSGKPLGEGKREPLRRTPYGPAGVVECDPHNESEERNMPLETNWSVYALCPIDHAWEHLKSVDATEKEIAEVGDGMIEPEDLRDEWRSAQEAAKAKGWEGDVRGDACVFWLPAETMFVPAFVFKQENNGTTFVV